MVFVIKSQGTLLPTYLVVIHVLVVPVALQPVLRSVLLHKIIDSVPEVVGFEQQQLNYEVANLSLVIFVATHRLEEEEWRSEAGVFPHGTYGSIISAHQTQDESVQSDYVVFPDHVVEYFNAFVELLSSSWRWKLVDEEICEGPHVSHQRSAADSFKDPRGVGTIRSYTLLSISYKHSSIPLDQLATNDTQVLPNLRLIRGNLKCQNISGCITTTKQGPRMDVTWI